MKKNKNKNKKTNITAKLIVLTENKVYFYFQN